MGRILLFPLKPVFLRGGHDFRTFVTAVVDISDVQAQLTLFCYGQLSFLSLSGSIFLFCYRQLSFSSLLGTIPPLSISFFTFPHLRARKYVPLPHFLHDQNRFFSQQKTSTKNVEVIQEHFLQNEAIVKYNALDRGLHRAFAFPLLLQCQQVRPAVREE